MAREESIRPARRSFVRTADDCCVHRGEQEGGPVGANARSVQLCVQVECGQSKARDCQQQSAWMIGRQPGPSRLRSPPSRRTAPTRRSPGEARLTVISRTKRAHVSDAQHTHDRANQSGRSGYACDLHTFDGTGSPRRATESSTGRGAAHSAQRCTGVAQNAGRWSGWCKTEFESDPTRR